MTFPQPDVLSSRVLTSSPGPGLCPSGGTHYVSRDAPVLARMEGVSGASDTPATTVSLRFSSDNGETWGPVRTLPTIERLEDGRFRFTYWRCLYLDPHTDRLLMLRNIGFCSREVFRNPDLYTSLVIHYSVSDDGGRSEAVAVRPIALPGAEHSIDHPFPGVWRGKNSALIGDRTCHPLTLEDGTILVPFQINPLGPDGKMLDPAGAITYQHSAVFRGRWQPDLTLQWELSDVVVADPERTTRGLFEPTLAVLEDGRILMVMRASNSRRPHLPCHKWAALSADGGRTWSPAEPWAFDDGVPFFSPSSCSRLLAHSSGELLWIGNIAPENPEGNCPRYPLAIGAVDRSTGRLARDSVRAIDTRRDDDGEFMTLSNFGAREDRVTREVVVELPRMPRRAGAGDLTGEYVEYRIGVGG